MHQPKEPKGTIPKFTCTESVKGAVSQGTYVHHNNTPSLTGRVTRNGDSYWIEIVRNPEAADETTVKKLVQEMRDWYYHAFVEPGQIYQKNMARIEELMLKGSDELSSPELAELERLANAAEDYEKAAYPIEEPGTREGRLERARMLLVTSLYNNLSGNKG